MLIDWFTVGAQVLNFLILVWLLKHFLYKPILNAIASREKLIATELADAAAKKTQAQKESDDLKKKSDEFDQQRAALLTKATDEANAERQKLLDEAHKAADALSAKRMEELKSNMHSLSQAISQRAEKEVFVIASKTLKDLAASSLEARMVELFIGQLRALDSKPKDELVKNLKSAKEPAIVRTAFDLPEAERASIQKVLNELSSADIHLQFETAPDVISGIELTTSGQKIAWSIADYLATLENSVDELLKERDKPEPKVETKPEAKVEPKPETKS